MDLPGLLALLALACGPEPTDTAAHSGADTGAEAAEPLLHLPVDPEPRCRELLSEYDAALDPVDPYDLTMAAFDLNTLNEVTWDLALDGSDAAPWRLGLGFRSEVDLVDWVADGSPEAVHPCREGPAVRYAVVAYSGIDQDQAVATLGGSLDGNGVDFWLSGLASDEVALSAEWQARVDAARDAAGLPAAPLVLQVQWDGASPPRVELGLRRGSRALDLWSGTMGEGAQAPTAAR